MESISAISDVLSLRVGIFVEHAQQSDSKANIRPMSQHRTTNGMEINQIPLLCLQYAVLPSCLQPEFKSADGRRWAQMKGERVHFEPWMGGHVKDMYRLPI